MKLIRAAAAIDRERVQLYFSLWPRQRKMREREREQDMKLTSENLIFNSANVKCYYFSRTESPHEHVNSLSIYSA